MIDKLDLTDPSVAAALDETSKRWDISIESTAKIMELVGWALFFHLPEERKAICSDFEKMTLKEWSEKYCIFDRDDTELLTASELEVVFN